MNNQFETFNQRFPNSLYREINKRYEGPIDNEEGHKKYQKSKAPINDKLLTYDEIKDTTNRVGWVVPKEYVVVDIDNMLNAKNVYTILIKQDINFIYMKSKHGGHFIFKNDRAIGNGAKNTTSLGISIDTRAMEKGYIILPLNDNDRLWGNLNNEIDKIPFFLVPLKKLKVYTDFVSLKDGDGRNSKLFEHFLNLKDYASELTLDEKVESIKLINAYIFEEPLPYKELEDTLLRDSIVNKPDNKVKGLEAISSDIVERYKLISTNDMLYIYNGKYYKPIGDVYVERIIHNEYDDKMIEKNRREVIKFIKLKAWVEPSKLNKNWNELCLRNGILNISEMKLYPHSPLSYDTIYVDCNYNPDVRKSTIIDSFFNMIAHENDDKKLLLFEIIGYCLIKLSVFEKFFIFYGEGSTGKSTYLNLIGNLLGCDNTTALSLQDLKNTFRPYELFGKLANIGDDISSKMIEDGDVLKKLISGQKVMIEEKHKKPIEFNNFAKLLYSANKIPTFQDRTSGMLRRMTLVEINRVISNPDPFFLNKVTESDYEYLLYKSVIAINNVLKRNRFTNVESIDLALKIFRQSQSSILTFIEDNLLTANNIHGKSVTVVYAEYKQFCEDSGFKPLNQINFRKEFGDELKMYTLNTTNGPNTQQVLRFKK